MREYRKICYLQFRIAFDITELSEKNTKPNNGKACNFLAGDHSFMHGRPHTRAPGNPILANTLRHKPSNSITVNDPLEWCELRNASTNPPTMDISEPFTAGTFVNHPPENSREQGSCYLFYKAHSDCSSYPRYLSASKNPSILSILGQTTFSQHCMFNQ